MVSLVGAFNNSQKKRRTQNLDRHSPQIFGGKKTHPFFGSKGTTLTVHNLSFLLAVNVKKNKLKPPGVYFAVGFGSFSKG